MLIVWDFDRTITLLHTCYPIALKKEQIETMPLSSIVADPELVSETFHYLRSMGHKLAIASYGRYEVIAALFARMDLKVDYIVTPNTMRQVHGIEWFDGFAPPSGIKKDLMLEYLTKITGYERKDTLLLDDTLANVESARLAGYLAIHVFMPYSKGLYKREGIVLDGLVYSWTALCLKLQYQSL